MQNTHLYMHGSYVYICMVHIYALVIQVSKNTRAITWYSTCYNMVVYTHNTLKQACCEARRCRPSLFQLVAAGVPHAGHSGFIDPIIGHSIGPHTGSIEISVYGIAGKIRGIGHVCFRNRILQGWQPSIFQKLTEAWPRGFRYMVSCSCQSFTQWYDAAALLASQRCAPSHASQVLRV